MIQIVKVKVPTSAGHIELEGTRENIRKLLLTLGFVGRTRKKNENTIKAQIINLIRNGYLREPRTFPEIRDELGRRGYKYKGTSLFAVLSKEFMQIDPPAIERIGHGREHKYFVSEPPLED